MNVWGELHLPPSGRKKRYVTCLHGKRRSMDLGFLTNWSSEMLPGFFSTHPTEIWCIVTPFGVTSRGWLLLLLLLCPQWLPLSHVLLLAHELCPGFLKVEDSSGDGILVYCLDECISINLIIRRRTVVCLSTNKVWQTSGLL